MKSKSRCNYSCVQLVQVATPTGLGQQSIVFVLITDAALYILRKGESFVVGVVLSCSNHVRIPFEVSVTSPQEMPTV